MYLRDVVMCVSWFKGCMWLKVCHHLVMQSVMVHTGRA